jgi:hypothetical protein
VTALDRGLDQPAAQRAVDDDGPPRSNSISMAGGARLIDICLENTSAPAPARE